MLRADLGLLGFPSKSLHRDFLSTFLPAFYIRQVRGQGRGGGEKGPLPWRRGRLPPPGIRGPPPILILPFGGIRAVLLRVGDAPSPPVLPRPPPVCGRRPPP